MTYRNELDAAHARIESLELEMRDLAGENTRLRAPAIMSQALQTIALAPLTAKPDAQPVFAAAAPTFPRSSTNLTPSNVQGCTGATATGQRSTPQPTIPNHAYYLPVLMAVALIVVFGAGLAFGLAAGGH